MNVLFVNKTDDENEENAVKSIRLRLTDSVDSFSGKWLILPISIVCIHFL